MTGSEPRAPLQGQPRPCPIPAGIRLANTPGMTGAALHANLRTPHRKMPGPIVPQNDTEDLLAYVLSLKH